MNIGGSPGNVKYQISYQGFVDSLRCELLHDKSNVRVTMAQMPALNTPQFRWVKSRLPHKAQPVPPIYQPEVAARAIHYAAHGVFDERSSDHSLQLWANTHRGLLALAGLGVVGAVYAAFSRNGR